MPIGTLPSSWRSRCRWGDFFCCGFGTPAAVTSIPITVGSVGGLNSYWPMPFGTGARIMIENQGDSTAWAFQQTFDRRVNPMPIPFNGPYCGYIGLINSDTSDWSDYALLGVPSHGMYRWHLPDPIRFDDSLNVTLQQIGHDSHVLFERSDDISSVAYWYQFSGEVDHQPLPPVAARRPR